MRSRLVLLAATLSLLVPAGRARALGSFVTFETGQTRPLALSPDGTKLFAANTPDNRLEIFDVGAAGELTHAASVPVGMEPVAVAARSNTEVWVVNHLSDSVSIVSLAGGTPRVVDTLLVGDEPRDVVFAGSGGNRAFVTSAHRGQNSGVPLADFTTEGIGRADVWVFDANALGSGLGGSPLTVIELFGDSPRALAVSPDGSVVYAAVFFSGNRTTTINEQLVCDGGASAGSCTPAGSGTTAPGGLPAPSPKNCANQTQPETGLIVKFNAAANQWRDTLGRNWSNLVRFQLPDQDVFAIDANANPPAPVGTPWTGVGTVLFNMAVNPVSGHVYVSNTDAHNEVRFEGPGGCSTTVQGHLHEARITVLSGSTVTPRHLNKHINYAVRPAPVGVAAKSLATPTDMAVTPDGTTLYVAAFGSEAVGVFDTTQLESDSFTPSAASHIALSGGGPSGLALSGNRLYVLTRFDNAISVVDTTTQSEIDHVGLFDPEPVSVRAGRPFLYDAPSSSSNGEASCSSCHVFGDFDGLAWDLGNPDEGTTSNPIPLRINLGDPSFFPMKGPMTTQSLRGMDNAGAMHWRGDRSNGFFGTDPFDETLSFKNFIVAFPGLLGKDGMPSEADMDAFAAFILQVTYPPNPIRNLDNTLTASQSAGSTVYTGAVTDGFFNCNGCHQLNPGLGFFGTDGRATFEGETQDFKIAHLRNVYQKIGMFGLPASNGITGGGPTTNQGPQVRGFGVLHDGSLDTVFRFLSSNVFGLTTTEKQDLEQFVLAFPTTLAPVVGQQITRTASTGGAVDDRITLLRQRAQASYAIVNQPGARECDLIAKGTIGGEPRGWLFNVAAGTFTPDKAAEAPLSETALRALADTPGQEITFTCAPPGSGTRMGIDRDLDAVRDGDDNCPDVANPGQEDGDLDGIGDACDLVVDTTTTTSSSTSTSSSSTTSTSTTTLVTSTSSSTTTSTSSSTTTTLPGPSLVTVSARVLKMRDGSLVGDPARRRLSFKARTIAEPAANRVVVPAPGSVGDPTLHGGALAVYNSAGSGEVATVSLPAGVEWSVLGAGKGYRYKASNPSAPVQRVVIKADTIKVKVKGAGWGYSLDEPSQGRVALRLVSGNVTWCADAPATPGKDVQDAFTGVKAAPAPATCPAVP